MQGFMTKIMQCVWKINQKTKLTPSVLYMRQFPLWEPMRQAYEKVKARSVQIIMNFSKLTWQVKVFSFLLKTISMFKSS